MRRTTARPEELAGKLAQLSRGGVDSLHLIVDFDRTMSHPDADNSWSCLKKSRHLSAAFHATTSELFRRFHPIEIDERLSVEERSRAMVEWWELSHSALLRENVTRQAFADMVRPPESNLFFRDRTDELVRLCERLNVPLLIFSAGLGDLIDAAVAREQWGEAVHVISNHMVFGGEGGVATAFAHDNIHTFSKKEVALTDVHEEWAERVLERKNVIVVGDSIGDIHMAEGVDHNCVVKVGFLNKGQESALDDYAREFDIVLQDDLSMTYLIDLIESVAGATSE